MRKMPVLLAIFIISGILKVSAQQSSSFNSSNYKTALGFKFFLPTAVTLKHFISPDKKALEFLGYFYNEGVRITGLYEFHNNINEVVGLKWYAGPGVHIALYNNKHDGFTSVGIDGVIGLDYKLNNAPINLSLDYQPSIQLTDYYGDRYTSWGGLALRYTF
ncbi:MAG: hypothetical protein ABIN97_01435 [Ginsengibacter sp.]